MNTRCAKVVFAIAALAAPPSFAASTFQQTCSNITFAYAGGDATIQAMCLRADGSPNKTSLTLKGIGNDNGHLVQSGGGVATFQHSCGNIGFALSPGGASLNAFCRTSGGTSQPASLMLENIGNNNGNLTQ